MGVSEMTGKHLVAVVLLVCVLGVSAVYIWWEGQMAQTVENAQSGVKNVSLSYLAQHMVEFENKKVRVEGIVQYYPENITETIGDFVLIDTDASVAIMLENISMQIPSENSIVVVEGIVDIAYGFYYIRAENWSYTRELSFETVSSEIYGGYDNHRYLVIESSEEWEKIWNLARGSEIDSLPAVNFSTHTIIAVFMGGRGSGGYGIVIKRITNRENEIIVHVEETYPGRMVVTLAFTFPHHIVKVERIQKPIVFEVQQFLLHTHDENWIPLDGVISEFLGEYRILPGGAPPEPSL
jgi:hypothetical protein